MGALRSVGVIGAGGRATVVVATLEPGRSGAGCWDDDPARHGGRGLEVQPRALVDRHARPGPGAVVRPAAGIGAHALVNTNAVVEHAGLVGEFAPVAPRAALAAGACPAEGARVGAGSVVGAGAVVTRHLAVHATANGVSAREAVR